MKKENYHCFEVGDLCQSQNGFLYAITEVTKNGEYKFMNLQNDSITTASHGIQVIQKGSVSAQPCSIFDKYHHLYQNNING